MAGCVLSPRRDASPNNLPRFVDRFKNGLELLPGARKLAENLDIKEVSAYEEQTRANLRQHHDQPVPEIVRQ